LRCGYIGTLGASYREWTRELANTTPLPIELHETLATMLEHGAQAVAMEVSSHALALHRVDDIDFKIGAFTNLTRDHLDFHGTTEQYAEAKHRLIEMAEQAVINDDDPHGAQWAADLRDEDHPLATYSLEDDADLVARDIVLRPDGSSFTLSGHRVDLPLPGRFNVQNALCALAIAHVLGCDLEHAIAALHALPPVPGRMERYAQDGVVAIVDYAHTPDALARALDAVRAVTAGKVWCVFGCGGDRDPTKRGPMGEAVARRADVAIVTNDNPRTEDARAIADAVVAGVRGAGKEPVVELDRRKAIELAVRSASGGDVVLVAGKGHEDYQIVGTVKHPFDDRIETRRALAERRASRGRS